MVRWPYGFLATLSLLAPFALPAAADRHPHAPAWVVELKVAGHPSVSLLLPDTGTGLLPAALVLADALGPDGREVAYVDRLLALGVAIVEVDPFTASDHPRVGNGDDARNALVGAVADAISRDPRLDPSRIVLLGFGAGARIGLRAAGSRGRHVLAATVALYPGCDVPDGQLGVIDGPLLLVHGGLDTLNTASACARLSQRATGGPSERLELPGAGYAWDRHPLPTEGRMLLPSPDGQERVAAEPWPYAADCSADAVTTWIARTLDLPVTAAVGGQDTRCTLRWTGRAGNTRTGDAGAAEGVR